MGECVWSASGRQTLAVVRWASILPSSLPNLNFHYNTVLPWDCLFKPEEMQKRNRQKTAKIFIFQPRISKLFFLFSYLSFTYLSAKM